MGEDFFGDEPMPPSVLDEVRSELHRARRKFPGAQNSAHEGYAVLAEEVDELWDEVKGNHHERIARMRTEAIQVAAMAIRFVEDVCDRAPKPTLPVGEPLTEARVPTWR